MTIKKLIKELEKLPEDYDVVFLGEKKKDSCPYFNFVTGVNCIHHENKIVELKYL